MPLEEDRLKKLVMDTFPNAKIKITDLAGDNDHWCLEIETIEFQGKTRIMQHKMVYDALQGYVGETLHALQLKTITPQGE